METRGRRCEIIATGGYAAGGVRLSDEQLRLVVLMAID
jgi:hypothetical protein